MVVNYQNGKIYVIESLIGNCKYYGSTTQTLAQRLGKHKRSNITSKQVLQYQDARILLVLKFPCNSKEELEAKEAGYIRNNDCVNKMIPQRTPEQYREDNKEKIKDYRDNNKEQQKQYYEDNQDKIKEYLKQYYEENKEDIIEKSKEYYENNKEKVLKRVKEYTEKYKEKISKRKKEYREKNKDKSKEYYENNKDELKNKRQEKISCDCGAEITKGCITRHCKTLKHQFYENIRNFILS